MRRKLSLAAAIVLAIAIGLTAARSSDPPRAAQPRPIEAAPPEASAKEVRAFCGYCHAYPPPETFPRVAWREEVRKGYDFFRDANLRLDTPDLERVVRYYENRAPETLPAMAREPLSAKPPPITFAPQGLKPPQCPALPGVTNVHLAPLFHKDKLDLIVCSTKPGRIWAVKLYENPPTWHLLCDT